MPTLLNDPEELCPFCLKNPCECDDYIDDDEEYEDDPEEPIDQDSGD